MMEIDRISATRRPSGAAAGYHVWSDLLFLHWRVPVELLQPLLPQRLTIDTFDGSAWLGIVPFRMSGVRPWWSPPVWGVSSFPETNVRTYVHYQGANPGAWFFSLDAANLLAVQLARWGWGLNYQWAKMQVRRQDSKVEYESRRIFGGTGFRATVEIGEPFPQGLSYDQTRIAEPGTLEHFLVERYLLYAVRHNALYRGQVYHRPYPLHVARVAELDQQLLGTHGIELASAPCHVMFSPRVNVEVFGLRSICPSK